MFQDKIAHVFFDLDHTIWDFDKNSTLAFDKIFRAQFPLINTEEFIQVYSPINHACWKLYQIDQITHDELRYKRLRDTFDRLDYPISDDEINQMAIDYITYLPENNQLFEGAEEILTYLYGKYTLHIITNGFSEVQYKKIHNSGISKYFKSITNSEKAGVKKPHPLIYEYALASASATKENAIMIGDCIEADVKGALNYGIEAIFFNPEKKEIPFDVPTISKLIDLKLYL
jgi:YjjG family noncanonical pyrimidine nucleotidase